MHGTEVVHAMFKAVFLNKVNIAVVVFAVVVLLVGRSIRKK